MANEDSLGEVALWEGEVGAGWFWCFGASLRIKMGVVAMKLRVVGISYLLIPFCIDSTKGASPALRAVDGGCIPYRICH